VGEKWNVFVWADCSCIVSTCQFHSCMMICPLGVRYFCTYTSLVNPTIEMLHHGHVHDSFIYPEKPFRPRSKYCCWPQTLPHCYLLEARRPGALAMKRKAPWGSAVRLHHWWNEHCPRTLELSSRGGAWSGRQSLVGKVGFMSWASLFLVVCLSEPTPHPTGCRGICPGLFC